MPRGKRGLYIALGSALTLVIIVLTAMKLPVFQGASSDSKSGVTAPAKVTPPPASATSNSPATDTTTTPAGGAAQPDTAAATSSAPASSNSAESAAEAKKARAAAAAKKEEEAKAAAAAQAAAEEAAKLFDEQENRFVHMSARAAAMKTSYETLKNQQAASGYSPDSTLTKALSTVDQFLGRAEAALSVHDGATAKKYMDMAEPQVTILERRFGR
jgi:molecular chaperone GrpE (heat shock protein)